MSTRESIFFATDENNRVLHVYWELVERDVEKKAAPVFIESEVEKDCASRLPPDVARNLFKALQKEPNWNII